MAHMCTQSLYKLTQSMRALKASLQVIDDDSFLDEHASKQARLAPARVVHL